MIVERIMQGDFDEAVRARAEKLKVMRDELRDLTTFEWADPEYDQKDG